MRSFRGFVVKEFKQIYRDKRTIVVLFGMPIIMLLLFGFAIRNEVSNVEIGILDASKDSFTKELIQKIDASDAFQVTSYLNSYDEISQVFKEGKVKEIIVFESSFENKLERKRVANIQLITDATDPNLANIVQSYTSKIIRNYVVEMNAQEGGNSAGVQLNFKMMYNPELASVNLFVPGLIAIILMLVSALMTSISITREKEMGNMEILLVSPLKPIHIILGKVLPYLVLSVINVIVILVLSKFVFQVPFEGSYALFFAESILFILTALSLGLLISSITNSQQTAMMIALAGLLLPTVLLSGFIFPIESMPFPLQIVSNIIPAKWYLIIVRGIMLKGTGILFLLQETVILLVTTLALIMLSLRNFKVRLE
ncbi:MAG: ABC transporter permease [Balneolaceae bacterium]